MSGISHFIRRHGLDALIVLGAAAAATEVALLKEPLRTPAQDPLLAMPAVALMVLLLLGRRRFPFGAPAGAWLIATALSFVDGALVAILSTVFLTGLVAAFLLGTLRDSLRQKAGLGVVLGCAALTIFNDPGHDSSDLVLTPALFAIAWLGGYAVRQRAGEADAARERAAQAEREREIGARMAVAEERIRIARELHDIVAHAVSVMVLQVGAVRHSLPSSREADREALEAVERTGRDALTQLRLLLGAMRQDGQPIALTPQPGLDNLDALIDDVVRAGLPVDVQVEGEPVPLARAIDLSAYRIIQEALTNVLKHAHARKACVTIRYVADALEVAVLDDGRGLQGANGAGHGLIGIRERVKIYDGKMTTEAGPDGGFAVRVRLPLGTDLP